MLRVQLLIRAGLVIAGLIWSKEIIGRWREDVAELKMADNTRRGVIIGMWVATVVIIAAIGIYVGGLIANIGRAF